MLKTSRQTPATNRVHTQLATAPSEAPAPAPAPDHHLTVLLTDIHKLKITTPRGAGRRGVRLGGPAAAPAALFDYSTSCGGDAALAMAAADVAVTCLQREGRGRAPGRAAPARGGRRDAVLRSHARAVEDAAAPRFCRVAARRVEADATSSCGATRAPSKTPPCTFLPRRRAGASPSSRRRPRAARTPPSACAPPPRSWTRNTPLFARHPRRSSSLSTSQDVLARTVVLLRGPPARNNN